MSEYIDYSIFDDQPVFPDRERDFGSASSLRVEKLWPFGQTKLSCALGDTHAIALIDYGDSPIPHTEAIAHTPTGIFRLSYNATGSLERIRVRATNMIIEGCDHVAADPDAKLHAKNMQEYDDALFSIFPSKHRMTIYNYGFSLEEPIRFVSSDLYGAGIDLPQFPDIRFAVMYSETYFSFSTLFGPDKKFAETFITSTVRFSKGLFTAPTEDMVREIGCDILGLQLL